MKKLIALIALMSIIAPAFAVKVNFLYEAKVPVSSQSTQERHQVLLSAINQVLIKVSGNNQIASNPKIKSHLTSPNTLVQEFSYSKPGNTALKAPYLLDIRFDPESINHLLRDAEVPIWGQNRPLIMVWIEFEAPNHPAEIISSDSISDIVPVLKQNAELRGIPILFPIMDATDINQVSTNDITTLSTTHIINASKRYDSDAILIGHIMQNTAGITSQWKLILANDQWDWHFSGKGLADIIPSLIDNVTNTFAARYAVMTTNNVQKDLTITVTGITQQEDFVQLVRYLNHLTPVANVELVRIMGNEVILNISLRSTQQSFTQAISLSHKLTSAGNDAETTLPIYQWNH